QEGADLFAIRRAEHAHRTKIVVQLPVNGFPVTELAKTVLAMVDTHAGRTDATKWQIFLCAVHDDVINADTARSCPIEKRFSLTVVGPEIIERERAVMGVYICDGIVNPVIGSYR